MISNKPLVVGVTGGSGSGKTFLVNQLVDLLTKNKVAVLSQDNYYRPIEEQTKDEQGIENFDLPGAIDHESFANDLQLLISGQSITIKEYNFNNTTADRKDIKIEPAGILLVEGIFIYYHQVIKELIDLKIYVDCDEQVMIDRRLHRDLKQRGYDAKDVNYRFENHVWPAYQQFIRPYKEEADLVVTSSQEDLKKVYEKILEESPN